MATERQTDPARWGMPALIASMVLQSFGPTIVKDASVGGVTFAFHRLWIASAITLVIAYATGTRLDRRALRLSWKGGVLFAVNLALFFSAVNTTSVASATILTSTHPLLMLFVTNRMFGEKAVRSEVLLAAVALCGVIMVVLGAAPGSGRSWSGDLLAVAAMVAFASYLAASKQARTELDVMTYQATYTIVAWVAMIPVLVVSGQGVAVHDGKDWLLMLAMVALPGVGHILVNVAHPHVRLVVVSLVLLCIPATSALLAWLLIAERLTAVQVVGTAIVLVALAAIVVRQSSGPEVRAVKAH